MFSMILGIQEALDLFWAKISANKDKVTPKQMSIRLRKMATPGEEGVMWSDFVASVRAQIGSFEVDCHLRSFTRQMQRLKKIWMPLCFK